MNNLQQRLIAGTAGAAIIITSVVLSEWSYFLLFFLICWFTIQEFYKLLGLDGNLPLKAFGTFVGLFTYTLVFVIERGHFHYKYLLILIPIASFVYVIKLYKRDEKRPLINIAVTYMGVLYVAVPFSLLHISAYELGGSYQYPIVLGVLFLLWASDIGGYFAGRALGKRKLFERVSPKKTWEGSIGGAVFSLVVAYGMFHLFGILPLWKWFTMSAIITIAGSYGDLVESLFKRSMDIKDSANSIPGHGGFLDRFDGLLLAAPFIAVFLRLM